MNSPTNAQRKAKQRFWRKVAMAGGNSDPAKLTDQQIARLSGDQMMVHYLGDAEFHDWFLNEKAEEDMIKAGAESAIQALMEIIGGGNEEVKPAVQVAAAKILLEMAGYGPKQQKEVVYKDQEVSKMSEEELRSFIQSQTEKIN